MDWLERMNAAIDYIEANLTGNIEMSVAARGACCSEYHFSRMFAFITEVPLNEYIRRRRLTLAGFELKNSDTATIIHAASDAATARYHRGNMKYLCLLALAWKYLHSFCVFCRSPAISANCAADQIFFRFAASSKNSLSAF